MARNRSIRDFFNNQASASNSPTQDVHDEDEAVMLSSAVQAQTSINGKGLKHSQDGGINPRSLKLAHHINPSPTKPQLVNNKTRNVDQDINMMNDSVSSSPPHLPRSLRKKQADRSKQNVIRHGSKVGPTNNEMPDSGLSSDLDPETLECLNPMIVPDRDVTIAKSSSQGSNKKIILGHSSPIHSFNASFSASEVSNEIRSTQSSSRRVIKNGVKGVTNSDSDGQFSDQDESKSDDDLGDVYQFIPQKRVKLSSPEEYKHEPTNGALETPARSSRRLAAKGMKKQSSQSAPVSPPQKVYKHSLADMIAQRQRLNQAEVRIGNLEKEIVEAKKREEPDESERPDASVDSKAFAATAESDSDDRERMLQALVRVEALKEKENYRFFLDDKPVFENVPFPVSSLPDSVWHRVMADDDMRVRACISGFVTELVHDHPLPLEITLWMAGQLTHENNDALCEAYVDIIQASLTHEESVSDTIGRLSCFYKTRSFSESLWKGGKSASLPHGLSYLVRVVAFTAPKLDARVPEASPSDTSAAILDLASLAIDELARRESSLLITITNCIESMLDALPEKSLPMLVTDITQALFESGEMSLRNICRLIIALPTGTSRAAAVRRRLALQCFVATSKANNFQESIDACQILVTALETRAEFTISESTDYDLLVVLISVLDLAVGPGFSGSRFTFHTTNNASNTSTEPVTAGSHDKQIDAIIRRLQTIASRIRDAGASHLRRTEAKSAIEHVVIRLEHGVRSKPRGKKGIFDAGEGSGKGSIKFFGKMP